MTPKKRRIVLSAFSLVEMLVVIAVIAIVTGIAIPNLAGLSSRANFAKDERHAQDIASLAAAARAAGATNQWTTVEAAIEDLENTVTVAIGTNIVEFRIELLADEDRVNVAQYLGVDADRAMVYYKGYAAE